MTRGGEYVRQKPCCVIEHNEKEESNWDEGEAW